MRGVRKLLILVTLFVMTDVLVVEMNSRTHIPAEVVAKVNPDFSAASLNEEQQLWFGRLWETLNSGNLYPDIDVIAATNDTYGIGRTLQPHILALHTAFRATGDIRLLDEMDRLMEIARAQLSDPDGDGYLNWVYLHETDSQYYQQDTIAMDEILAHNLVAFFAYVLRQNQDVKPQYREHADFWEDYLLHHFIAKWVERGNGWFALDKSLTHIYAHMMTLNYYLFRLTGDVTYLEEAERRANVLNNMMVLEDNGSFTWDHRVEGYGIDPLGCQLTDYARYTLSAFQQMAFEGFSYYADEDYMQHYAVTIRDNMLQQNGTVVAQDVCGTVGDTHAAMDYVLSMMSCYARWDETESLLTETMNVWKLTEPESPRTILIPSCMVSVFGGT